MNLNVNRMGDAMQVEPWSSNARSSIEQDAILIGDYTESTSCPSVVVSHIS